MLATAGRRPQVIALALTFGALVVTASLGTVKGEASTPRVIDSTYVIAGSACDVGDFPLSGGFHAFDTHPRLVEFRPESTGGVGDWSAPVPPLVSEDGAPAGPGGQTLTVCAHPRGSQPWVIRDRPVPSTDPQASVPCNTDEYLLGGGARVPWGIAALQGSGPRSPSDWAISASPPGGNPIDGEVDALCATLPSGVHTYVVSASRVTEGDVTANCFTGDAVLNGGWSGGAVWGSRPSDHGWTASTGPGGGSASALCFTPSARFGIASTYVHSASKSPGTEMTATCDPGDMLLTAGSGYHQLDDLHVFEPVPPGDSAVQSPDRFGWTMTVSVDATSQGLLAVLCGRPAAAVVATSHRDVAWPGVAVLIIGSLIAVGAVVRPGMPPIAGRRGAVIGAGIAAIIAGVLIALLPLVPGTSPTPTRDNPQLRHRFVLPTQPASVAPLPTATPTSTATPTPSPTAAPTVVVPTQPTHMPSQGVLTATPQSYQQICDPNMSAGPQDVTLTATVAPISWSAQAIESVGGTAWATISPASGTLAPGTSAIITIQPSNPGVCASAPSGGSSAYHVALIYGPPGSAPTETITVTDTILRP